MSDGRVAVIAGGLTGIGLASAMALRAAGCAVAVGSRRGESGGDEGGGGEAAAARAALGPEAHIGRLDIADAGSVRAFVAAVESGLGAPDILVAAAGVYEAGALDDPACAGWFAQIDVNLSGPYRLINAVLPGMKARGWGRIVTIASTAAHVSAAGYAGYSASKAGLVALTKAAAAEGAAHGVSAVSISPTWVETPMMDRAVARGAADKAALAAESPQRRIVQPDEVAALVAFCCSDAAPALTNEDIQVNAGNVW